MILTLFRIKKKNFAPIFISLSLGLISQTSFRLFDGIGIGEIAIILFILYTLSRRVSSMLKTNRLRTKPIIGYYLVFLLFFLLPITAISTTFSIPGSAFRDLFAYLLSGLLIYSLSTNEIMMKRLAFLTTTLLIGIVWLQYFFGHASAWYSIRFTGGATNPNQLALYLICSLVLIRIAIPKKNTLVLLFIIIQVIFLGLLTLSDAFFASIAAALCLLPILFVLSKPVTPSKLSIYILILLALLIPTLKYIDPNKISYIISSQASTVWKSADEGNGRLTLYKNGIKAWLDTPISILFGNGAGCFSGLSGPFQKSEAHNTPIDLLSVGGLVGFGLLYGLLFFYLFKACFQQKIILASFLVSLICFTLFHFVIRHPIFWTTILALSFELKNKKTNFKLSEKKTNNLCAASQE